MRITQTTNPYLLSKAIKELQKKSLQVGWNEEAKYEDGDSVAQVAAQNEFGNPSKNIPPRPFMRPAIAENSDKWKQIIKREAKKIINGKATASSSLETLGLTVSGDIRKSITQVTSPALKTSTVEARLRGKKQGNKVSLSIAKPLIDSGWMMSQVTSEIVE